MWRRSTTQRSHISAMVVHEQRSTLYKSTTQSFRSTLWGDTKERQGRETNEKKKKQQKNQLRNKELKESTKWETGTGTHTQAREMCTRRAKRKMWQREWERKLRTIIQTARSLQPQHTHTQILQQCIVKHWFYTSVSLIYSSSILLFYRSWYFILCPYANVYVVWHKTATATTMAMATTANAMPMTESTQK